MTAPTTMPVDAVLFDLDDTLCRYRRSPATVLERAFERAGVDTLFEPSTYHDRYGDYLEDSSSVADLRERCFGDLAVESGFDRDVGVAVAEAFAAERDQRAVDPLSGVPDVLEALGEEYRLGLVTNGNPEMQREKLDAIGLTDAFETTVFAGYDTAPKPDPEPFGRVLETLETDPGRAVYVGNSLSSDVAGARAAGIRSVWVPPKPDVPAEPTPRPDYTLESLADLEQPPWLES
ncbi:HAD family hydrolase [Natronosalvus caseinilyticus]|uniref:HAD family hydrolase n=1 Tax=Natronosalvus caseinilyticus TaxID=2953747 RepID=UPI0028A63797|nr:HAD family hydrolase [Natronosalvus caseinilyticus]